MKLKQSELIFEERIHVLEEEETIETENVEISSPPQQSLFTKKTAIDGNTLIFHHFIYTNLTDPRLDNS